MFQLLFELSELMSCRIISYLSCSGNLRSDSFNPPLAAMKEKNNLF